MERSKLKSAVRDLASTIPIHLRMGPRYWLLRRFLDGAQHWSASRIRDWQYDRLHRIVTHAYQNTSGYRQLYDEAGIRPADLRTLDDLKHFPFVDKYILQANVAAFTDSSIKADYCSTGGSSGVPFSFHQTRHLKTAVEQAFMHTGWSWLGWKLGMTSAALRGAYVGSAEKFFEFDRLYNELHLSSYYLIDKSTRSYLDVINQHDCDVIHAYPSQYFILCDLIGQMVGLNAPTSARFAFMGSENVYDWQLSRCREVFPDTRIFTWYGHTEKAILAPWCEHSQQYHVWPFYGICEVLDTSGREVPEDGEGEMVGTSLHGLATPFIRYRTEDRAVRGPDACPHCGRNFPLLKQIVGRNHEAVISKTGRFITMTAIAGSIHGDIFERIAHFQFLQDTAGEVTFKYVAKPDQRPDEATLLAELTRIFGDDVKVVVLEVGSIARTKLGKFTYLDQRLRVRYGADNAST